ncbi:hypothetical protein LXL04_034248 [Taraxacum kok-saghyz]
MCIFFLNICKVFGKKNHFFGKKKFATGLVFERFLAPRIRFFEKVNGLGVLGKDPTCPNGHLFKLNETIKCKMFLDTIDNDNSN